MPWTSTVSSRPKTAPLLHIFKPFFPPNLNELKYVLKQKSSSLVRKNPPSSIHSTTYRFFLQNLAPVTCGSPINLTANHPFSPSLRPQRSVLFYNLTFVINITSPSRQLFTSDLTTRRGRFSLPPTLFNRMCLCLGNDPNIN